MKDYTKITSFLFGGWNAWKLAPKDQTFTSMVPTWRDLMFVFGINKVKIHSNNSKDFVSANELRMKYYYYFPLTPAYQV